MCRIDFAYCTSKRMPNMIFLGHGSWTINHETPRAQFIFVLWLFSTLKVALKWVVVAKSNIHLRLNPTVKYSETKGKNKHYSLSPTPQPPSMTLSGTRFWYSETGITVETLYSTIYYSKYFIELNIDKSTQYVTLWTHKRHPIPRHSTRVDPTDFAICYTELTISAHYICKWVAADCLAIFRSDPFGVFLARNTYNAFINFDLYM